MMKVNLVACNNRPIIHDSVQCLIRACLHRYNFQLLVSWGVESMIDRTRAMMATQFLDSDNDILFFLDDDILYNPEDIQLIIDDCIEKETIVAAPYLLKKPGRVLALRPLDLKQEFFIGPEKGCLQEIRYAATGFMAIPRKVIADVAATMERCNKGRDSELFPMFLPMVYEGDYLSEDFAFCQRARALGYKVWLDSRIKIGHVGTFVYSP